MVAVLESLVLVPTVEQAQRIDGFGVAEVRVVTALELLPRLRLPAQPHQVDAKLRARRPQLVVSPAPSGNTECLLHSGG